MGGILRCTGVTFQVRVSDYSKGIEWYSMILGRPADFNPHEGHDDFSGFSEWEIIKKSNCWLQVAEGDPTPGSGPIRLGVDDLEMEVGRVAPILDGYLPDIHTTPDGKVRFCTFEDPFGNRIGFFQEIST